MPAEAIDLILDAACIVPVEPARTVLTNHSLAVHQGTILALAPQAEIHQRYRAQQHLRLTQHVLLPGLVNLHSHAAMTLMRGMADDLPLMQWLKQHIWPAEAQLVSPRFVQDGALLACAEMIKGGITCVNDMYFFPEAVLAAVKTAGLRAALGMMVIEFPSAYARTPEEYIQRGLDLYAQIHGDDRLSACLAPHAPYTVSDRTFARLGELSQELQLPLHIHLHETREEIRQEEAQHGVRPLARLARLGLVNERLLAVHAVHLLPEEIEQLAQHGCSIAHCPASNLKLASGIAPLPALLAHGVNNGLGTDGAASNNRLDIFQEMRLAALLAKGASGDATAAPAFDVLRMATLDGARALGLAGRIGSLVPGKAADVIAVRLDDPASQPCFDVISHLVYVLGREQVSHAWVAGQPLLADGQLLTLDAQELAGRAAAWQPQVRAAAG